MIITVIYALLSGHIIVTSDAMFNIIGGFLFGWKRVLCTVYITVGPRPGPLFVILALIF